MITRRTLHALLDFFPWKFWKCPCRTGHKNSLRYFRKPHGQQSAFKMVVDWSGWHLNRFSRLWISESESIVLVNPNSKNLLKRVLHSRKKKKKPNEKLSLLSAISVILEAIGRLCFEFTSPMLSHVYISGQTCEIFNRF